MFVLSLFLHVFALSCLGLPWPSTNPMKLVQCCAFTHDRYRQAAVNLTESLEEYETMSLRLVDLMLQRKSTDVFRLAEYVRKCTKLLRIRRNNAKYRDLLERAANVALVSRWTSLSLIVSACELSLIKAGYVVRSRFNDSPKELTRWHFGIFKPTTISWTSNASLARCSVFVSSSLSRS